MSSKHSWEEIVRNFHEKFLSGIMEVIDMPAVQADIPAIASPKVESNTVASTTATSIKRQ